VNHSVEGPLAEDGIGASDETQGPRETWQIGERLGLLPWCHLGLLGEGKLSGHNGGGHRTTGNPSSVMGGEYGPTFGSDGSRWKLGGSTGGVKGIGWWSHSGWVGKKVDCPEREGNKSGFLMDLSGVLEGWLP